MKITATSPDDYIKQLPEDRAKVISKLRELCREHLPKGFKETLGYGMIAFVVPKNIYPDGYHVNPELPLPFINIASQKHFVALYHSGIYADKELYNWFVTEYPKYAKYKLDMGKSCIRFKRMDDIPYLLIKELLKKMTPKQWIALYEKVLKS